MKITTTRLALLFAASLMLCVTAVAQPPEGGPGRRPGGRGPGGPGERGPGGPGGPPRIPLIEALDADGDGEISAKEIENAVAVLKKLDKDNNGKLTREEILPPRRGPGGPGGPGRPGFGRPGGGPGAGGPGGRGGAGVDIVARVMQLDKNKDGKVTKEEASGNERMGFLFERGDTNKDGAVTKAELESMMENFRRRRGEAGEGGPRRGGRGGEGDRPRRPPVDDDK